MTGSSVASDCVLMLGKVGGEFLPGVLRSERSAGACSGHQSDRAVPRRPGTGYMRRVDATHPGWAFAQHVGYATPSTARRSSVWACRPFTACRCSRPPTSG